MRKRLIISFSILFLLFTIGAGLAIHLTYKITRDFDSMMTLHRIEILRQIFVTDVQTVQSNLYATRTIFGKELDTTIQNVTVMDESIKGCQSCHHNPEMTERLKKVQVMVEQYKQAISFLVTASANEERIDLLKKAAVGIGDALIEQTREMAAIADRTLTARTKEAVHAINDARKILIATLGIAFLLGLSIAINLTRQITKPVHALANASRLIAAGNLGLQADYRDDTEFGEVAKSFNAMSMALKEEREKTDRYIEQLSGLYKVTLSFYDILELGQTFQETCQSIADILKVKQVILILSGEKPSSFCPYAACRALSQGTQGSLRYTIEQLVEFYQVSDGNPIVINESSDIGPYASLFPDAGDGTNMMAAWLLTKEKILGMLRVSGKDGNFTEEDVKILIILANHMAVAMENADLYRDLQRSMEELRETQEQLIQSAKLAAIGELASNVAHEINNPLTSIIGFAELSKEEDDMEAVRKSLEIIEKESLRARDIVKQLLGFARKKPLQLTAVAINDVLREAVSLSSSQARMGRVKVVEEYQDVPVTTGDVDQLKQVFLNIITNAVHAMPDGGSVSISTSALGEYIFVRMTDTGHGIPSDLRQRIFEPFFSTKKDKGTGLGLSISYRIIRDHGGRIDVESEEGKGTTFVVRLPIRNLSIHH